MKRLILASNSPRRKEILHNLNLDFVIIPSKADETFVKNLDVKENVKLTAMHKALDVFNQNRDSDIIGADTIVVFEGEVFGKPKDKEDAKRMLKKLSGNTHHVYTGVCIIKDEKPYSYLEESTVTFREISEQEIIDYINSGEPMDKAGAYAIQGIGAKFVSSYDGEFETIVGLPIIKLKEILGI